MDLTADWTQQKKGLVKSKTGRYKPSKLKYGAKEQKDKPHSTRDLGDSTQQSNILVTGVPEKEKGGSGDRVEDIF